MFIGFGKVEVIYNYDKGGCGWVVRIKFFLKLILRILNFKDNNNKVFEFILCLKYCVDDMYYFI